MALPSESEINVHNSLDEIAAKEHFLNKTLYQAEQLFRENSSLYQEDLMWMGPRAFAFYLRAATMYLMSTDSKSDDHFISCLSEIISFRSQQPGFELALDSVKELIEYVIENYQKFSVQTEVYGDLLSKY